MGKGQRFVLPRVYPAASSLISKRLEGSSLPFSFVAYILRITDVGVNDGDNCKEQKTN